MIDILKCMNRLLNGPQKAKIFLNVILMILLAIMETLWISMIIPVVSIIIQPDVIMENKTVMLICSKMNLTSEKQILITILLGMIVIFIAKAVLAVFQLYTQARFIHNSQYQMQGKFLNMFLNKPYQDFLDLESPWLIRVISGEVRNVFVILSSLMSLMSEGVTAAILTTALLVINPGMTLVTTLILVVTISATNFFIKSRLFRWGKAAQEENVAMSRWLHRSFEGIKEIKIGHLESFFRRKYMESGCRCSKMETRNTVFSNVPRILTETTFFCGMLTFLLILVVKGVNVDQLFTELTALLVAAMRLMPSANRINLQMNQIYYLRPSLSVVIDIFDKEAKQGDCDTEVKGQEKIKESVRLRDIDFKYPNSDKYVLKNANMMIPIGKSVGIIGASGAGKSTTIDLMLGLLKKSSGEILVDGVDTERSGFCWAAVIGYIPQTIFLMDDTIKANVALGIPEANIDEKTIWSALTEAQLADHVRKMPNGIYTLIGERGVKLSGGQRQRLGIARALYKEPQILIMDEATSALDSDTEAAIMESINHFHGKKTMIIIAHRLTTIQNCDIVYRVENGKITEVDTPI